MRGVEKAGFRPCGAGPLLLLVWPSLLVRAHVAVPAPEGLRACEVCARGGETPGTYLPVCPEAWLRFPPLS